jgi:hypothetical protein
VTALAVVLAAALVAGAALAALAIEIRRRQRRANQVVPGIDGPAPRSWTGAHTPEARLHRRLRDAMAALQAVPGLDAVTPGGRAELDRHALALDERLVAVAAVAESERGPALGRVAADIEALESAVGGLTTQAVSGRPAGADAVRWLSQHMALLDEARAELDGLESGAPPLSDETATDPAVAGAYRRRRVLARHRRRPGR